MTNKHKKSKSTESHVTLKQAVIDYAQGRNYFQISELKQGLEASGVAFRDESVKKYLYQLKKAGRLFDAGRGWYSNIASSFVLDTTPIKGFAKRLKEEFPLLTFSCWSTAQLQSYFHHLQSKTLLFVYVEKDALLPVFEYLRQDNTNCYLNPHKRDVKQTFRPTEKAIVVRPMISEEPKKSHYATIEKILVDLFIEHKRLDLFDDWEYQQLFKTIVTQYRVNMAGLMRYAGRREIKEKIPKLIH